MTLVIDASAALKWVVDEPDSGEALQLLALGEALIAPDLVIAEMGNALWRHVRMGRITSSQAAAAGRKLGRPFDELVAVPRLMPRALEISLALDHPIYDCFYLALSESADAPRVTADERLLGRLAGSSYAAHTIREAFEGRRS